MCGLVWAVAPGGPLIHLDFRSLATSLVLLCIVKFFLNLMGVAKP